MVIRSRHRPDWTQDVEDVDGHWTPLDQPLIDPHYVGFRTERSCSLPSRSVALRLHGLPPRKGGLLAARQGRAGQGRYVAGL
eukprot:9469591-Heterocapsa_arctica.AAC.1